MGQCCRNILFTFLLGCWLYSLCECSFANQDGSRLTSKHCQCDSVEFWLPKRKINASKLLSFETNRPSYELLSKERYRRLRLWLPKHCELSLDKPNENAQFHRQNIADWAVELLLDADQLLESCLTTTIKCNERSLCVGVDTGRQGSFQSTQRKLLMFRTDSNEDAFAHQPYGVFLSVVIFCLMIVLVALCGKAERNSHESVARDNSADFVKIVSSEKVESTPGQSVVEDAVKHNHKAKPETIEIKVEGLKDLTTDRNSNNATQHCVDNDLDKVDGKTSVDGAVFGKEARSDNRVRSGEDNKLDEEKKNEGDDSWHGSGMELDRKKESSLGEIEVQEGKKGKRKDDKEKEKHEKRKEKEEKRKEKEREKEVKSKDRSKDMRSKRSHTTPNERAETKPLPKTSFSLKTNLTSTSEERKLTKKERKRSKKGNIDSPVSSQPPFSGATNRHSFINRELPKRPATEIDDDDGDYDYPKLTVPPGSNRSSANVDNNVYDSVDDVAAPKEDDSDMYETVDHKLSKLKGNNNIPPPQLYESVTGEYEEPRIGRQRSYSDIVPSPSTPRTDAERRVMSLGREKKREDAPTPPPLADLKIVAQSHSNGADETKAQQVDEKSDETVIDPYTVTVKKGDFIIQEVNFTDEPRLPKSWQNEEKRLSPKQIEELYTKVDKEKQKKDREEAENEATEDGGIEGQVQANGEGAVSSAAVKEHQYESMPDKKDTVDETENTYEEVVPRNNAK